jgi:hypothetical protein
MIGNLPPPMKSSMSSPSGIIACIMFISSWLGIGISTSERDPTSQIAST